MDIKPIQSQKQWDDFVIKNNNTFLHSWAWGELNKKTEGDILRIGFYKDEILIGVALVVIISARRGRFFLVPHGPVIANNADVEKIIGELTNFIKKENARYKTIFLRISPIFENSSHNSKIFKNLKYKSAPIYMHAEDSWILKLNKSKEEILSNMRKTTRNLIRRSEKEDIKIVKDKSEKSLEEFYKLYKETVKKHSFTPFSYEFLRTEISEFEKYSPDSSANLYTAQWKGHVLSGAIIIYYGDSAYYHHGANSLSHTKIPSSYALQYRAICDAMDNGKKIYNFWGITKSKKKKHPWAGLTLFKTGFGGEEREYLHAYDLPFSRKYLFPYIIDKARMMKRGV